MFIVLLNYCFIIIILIEQYIWYHSSTRAKVNCSVHGLKPYANQSCKDKLFCCCLNITIGQIFDGSGDLFHAVGPAILSFSGFKVLANEFL